MNEDELRRIIRDLQRSYIPRIAPLVRQAQELQRTWITDEVRRSLAAIQEFQRSSVAAEVRRSIEALQGSLAPRVSEIARLINQANLERTRELLAVASEIGKANRELRERAFPPNWTDFSMDEIKACVEFMDETGYSLVWVPRGEIVRELLATPVDRREQVLVESAAAIMEDLDGALAEIRHTELIELRDHVADSVAAFRDGHPRAAQALATSVLTTAMHVHLGLKRFKDARDEFSKRDPMEVEVTLFKIAAIYKTANRAVETYMGKDDEPIPTIFNRHASTHRVSRIQYTKANAIAALLLVTSLLRELEPLFHFQFPERNDDENH
jgi:hypothetical protein